MSNIKPERPEEASVHRSNISMFKPCLEVLQKLTTSTRSPYGKTKLLQNSSGGCLTVTSSSKRLLQSLMIRKPVIQLLVSACQGHLETFKDGGLFVLGFSSTLIVKAISSEINPRLLAEIFECVLSVVKDILSRDICFKFKACVSDITFMTNFIKSIIRPKTLCQLDGELLSFISRLILEVFLHCVNDQSGVSVLNSVYIFSCEDTDVKKCQIFEGIMLPAPDLSRFRKQEIGMKTGAKCIVVTASMSGDFVEMDNIKYELDAAFDNDAESVDHLLAFCEVRC